MDKTSEEHIFKENKDFQVYDIKNISKRKEKARESQPWQETP